MRPDSMSTFELLELVALSDDKPDHGLCAGDIGTVVEVYDGGGLEVEFVEASGETRAVLTLSPSDVRKLQSGDMLAVRHTAAR
jgi:hypothetical protein